MPRTIIARPLGGASGNVRRRYAVRQKLQLLEEWNRLQRSWNHSIRSAPVEMGISPCLLVRWYQKRPQFEASLGKSKAICEWPEGQLHRIKGQLLHSGFCSARAGDRRDDVPRHVQGDVDPPPPGGQRLLQGQWVHGAPIGRDPLPCEIRFRISNQDQQGYQVAGGGVRGGVRIHGEGSSMSSWTPSRSALHLEHGPDARLFFVSVRGHGILAGTYLAEYRDSLK